jgi:hypothetical protein
VYETYRDEIVTIIDVRHTACQNPHHVAGNVVPTSAAAERLTARSPRD